MNNRKKIKALKADNKILYKTLEKYLDALVAVEMALNPDNPFMAPGYPTPAHQVKDLVQENTLLQAEIDTLTGRGAQRHLSIGRAIERAAELLPDRMSLLVEAEIFCICNSVFVHPWPSSTRRRIPRRDPRRGDKRGNRLCARRRARTGAASMTETTSHSLLGIIASGLAAHGYSGLVCPGVCGCEIDDLSPGGCMDDDCLPGYRHAHSQRIDDWLITTSQEAPPDSEIDDWCLWGRR